MAQNAEINRLRSAVGQSGVSTKPVPSDIPGSESKTSVGDSWIKPERNYKIGATELHSIVLGTLFAPKAAIAAATFIDVPTMVCTLLGGSIGAAYGMKENKAHTQEANQEQFSNEISTRTLYLDRMFETCGRASADPPMCMLM